MFAMATNQSNFLTYFGKWWQGFKLKQQVFSQIDYFYDLGFSVLFLHANGENPSKKNYSKGIPFY